MIGVQPMAAKSWLGRFLFIPLLCGMWLDVTAQGFQSITHLKPLAVARNTGEKPQSKVWHYDGKWWAVFPVSTGTYVWKLDGTSWTNVLKISSSTSVEADCKPMDEVCHIFLWRTGNNASQLVSVEYNRTQRTYELWKQRTSMSLVQLDSGAETGTIDIDGTGRMWLASDGIDDIRVRWSDPPYVTWSSPVIVATGVTDDDICAIIALRTQGQMGILWSDQNAKKFGFKTHNDGNVPSSWSSDESPGAQSALNIGKGLGDDHLNMALANDGTLYCAVKTSYDTPGYTQLGLLRRRPSGTWEDIYEVSQSGTRGIVILNEKAGLIKIVYTSREDGGDILYRESPISNISFGEAETLISGAYNNPTSTKNNYESDVVILASDNANLVSVLATDLTSITVAISPQNAGEQLVSTIYPNPVDNVMTLQLGEEIYRGVSISIYDPSGRIYVTKHASVQSQSMEIDLHNFHLPTGVHFLRVQSGGSTRVFRFMKR